MDTVIYESSDTTLLSFLEQALNDSKIPYTVSGGSSVGFAPGHPFKVCVPKEFAEVAKEIVNQIIK